MKLVKIGFKETTINELDKIVNIEDWASRAELVRNIIEKYLKNKKNEE